MMWQADALGATGRIEEAMALIVQAQSLIEQSGMENDAAEIRRVEGELHRRAGNHAAARSAFEAAAATARRQEALLYEGRAREEFWKGLAPKPRTRAIDQSAAGLPGRCRPSLAVDAHRSLVVVQINREVAELLNQRLEVFRLEGVDVEIHALLGQGGVDLVARRGGSGPPCARPRAGSSAAPGR